MNEFENYRDPKFCLQQAQRCRRLAKATTDSVMHRRLLALAEKLERISAGAHV